METQTLTRERERANVTLICTQLKSSLLDTDGRYLSFPFLTTIPLLDFQLF